jgi:Carbohydrate-selective porin, OprB family
MLENKPCLKLTPSILQLKTIKMNTFPRCLNWLIITASSVCATLLLATASQAIDSITTNPNSSASSVTQVNPNQLIAAKRKSKKRIVRRRVRIRTRIKPATTVTAPTTSPTDVTQTAPPPVTPPPAPAEPSITREEIEALRKSNQELREELIRIDGKATETTKKVEQIDKQQFSINTKLSGQVIFGLTGTVAGDFDRNTAFGHRTRLELATAIGEGTLTTRLQAGNLGSATAAIPDGSLSWTGDENSTVGIDALKYEFPLSPQTQVVVAANAGASDDFADTINPYFDGDGASGSISAFGNRPSIYYTAQGAGVGIRHKFSETTELSLGYLAGTPNLPTTGNGVFGGSYGALAQLTFKTGGNSKMGLTYSRTLNADAGTGSTNANLGGTSNNFGLQGSFSLSPQFALGGWAGYTQNQLAGADRQIWSWAVTAAAPNFGGEGNLAGLLVGQSPRVTSASDGTADTKAGLHIEGFYQMKLSDNLSITPGIIYLTAPNHDVNSQPAVIGALRTTFTF